MSAQKQNEDDEGNRWRSIPSCGESLLPHQDAARVIVPIPADMFASARSPPSRRVPAYSIPGGVGSGNGSRASPSTFPGCDQYWPVSWDARCKSAPRPLGAGIRRQPGAQDSALTIGELHGTTFRVFRYSRVDRGPAGSNTGSPRLAAWHRTQSEAADRAVAQETDRESDPGAGSSAPSREPPLGE
jgi:hypothetical protein